METTLTGPDEAILLYAEAKKNETKTVEIYLSVPESYGIEGEFGTLAGVAPNSVELVGGQKATDLWKAEGAKVRWLDMTFNNSRNGQLLKVTYSIPHTTVAGEYTVTFTQRVFVGADREAVEKTETYSVTITVEQHKHKDVTNDGDHICDDDACGIDGVTKHNYTAEWHYGEDGTHWHECECGDKSSIGEHKDTTLVDHKCDICGKDNISDHAHHSYGKDEENHWSVCVCGEIVPDSTKPHDFTNGDCVCGAKKPGMLGDLDKNGVVDANDLTALAQHVAGIVELTDAATLINADVDGNGSIDSNDLTLHACYVAGIVDSWN